MDVDDVNNDPNEDNIKTPESIKSNFAPVPAAAAVDDTNADNNHKERSETAASQTSLKSSSVSDVQIDSSSKVEKIENGENELTNPIVSKSPLSLPIDDNKSELNLHYSSEEEEQDDEENEQLKRKLGSSSLNKKTYGNIFSEEKDECDPLFQPKKKRYKFACEDYGLNLLGFNELTGEVKFAKDSELYCMGDVSTEECATTQAASVEIANRKSRQSPRNTKEALPFKSPAPSPRPSSTLSSATSKRSPAPSVTAHIVGDNEDTEMHDNTGGGDVPLPSPSVKSKPSPAVSSGNSASSSNSVAKKLPPTDEHFRKPFDYGWKRELVWRSPSDSSHRERADVYYITPKGKRLRSRHDIIPYLKGELTIDHFNFAREVLGAAPEFEIVRYSKPTHRSSSTAATLAAAATMPASIGKRTPKPKGPKGASPPPEGWTAARALKVNNAALQHSSPSHRSSGSHSSHHASPSSSRHHQNSTHSTGGGSSSSSSSRQHSSKTKKSPTTGMTSNASASAPASAPAPAMEGNVAKQPTTVKGGASNVHSPCTYACPKASGLVPKLQCSNCLCLYHHECVGLNRHRCEYRCVGSDDTDSHTGREYICEACQPPASQPKSIAAQVSNINSKTGKIINASNKTTTMANTTNTSNSNINNANVKSSANAAARKAGNGQKFPQSIAVIKGKKYFVVSKPVAKTSKNHHVNDIENDLRQIKEGIQHTRKSQASKSDSSSSSSHQQNSTRQSNSKGSSNTSNNNTPSSAPASVSAVTSTTMNVDIMNKVYSTNFFANMSFAYGALVCILKYLKIHERSRAASVCKLWNLAAKDTSLWQTVRMKNSKVSNWSCFMGALRRGETERLDLRKMLWPHSRSDETWNDFLQYIGTVCSLEVIDLCRCPARVVENLFKTNLNLRVLNATAINDDNICLENLDKLAKLEELRLRSVDSFLLVGDLKPLQQLTTLKHLALTSLRCLNAKDVAELGNLETLQSLELGECGDFESDFAEITLPCLKNLQRLRLENGQVASIDTLAILAAVMKMPQLTQLELVNFDIKVGFDEKLSQCTGLRKLLIIPTYISQSATTNNIVLNAVQQINSTLAVFTWGVTVELIRVTALYVDQCEDSTKKEKTNQFSECIPVLKPVPGSETDEDRDSVASTSNDAMASDVPQIEILPLERVESILAMNMPNTKFTIVKVPYQSTSRQQIVE